MVQITQGELQKKQSNMEKQITVAQIFEKFVMKSKNQAIQLNV